jgi:hypothetical protein
MPGAFCVFPEYFLELQSLQTMDAAIAISGPAAPPRRRHRLWARYTRPTIAHTASAFPVRLGDGYFETWLQRHRIVFLLLISTVGLPAIGHLVHSMTAGCGSGKAAL